MRDTLLYSKIILVCGSKKSVRKNSFWSTSKASSNVMECSAIRPTAITRRGTTRLIPVIT